ncbi:uncharacterized protein DS421_19g646870 [Arachis hypogaea]|uniref:Uncharacterized protein n=1 Tax=Arachis hypogaea TaxID=3818 RepID=A0A6B9V971_ARAHY|nr:uncharacterized protein DS421_19g646870 [Arachis hypogaea]
MTMVAVTPVDVVALSSFSDLLHALFLPDQRQRQRQTQSMAVTDATEPAATRRDDAIVATSPHVASAVSLPLFFPSSSSDGGVCNVSVCEFWRDRGWWLGEKGEG